MQYSLFCLLDVMSRAKLTLQKGTSRVQWWLYVQRGTEPLLPQVEHCPHSWLCFRMLCLGLLSVHG